MKEEFSHPTRRVPVGHYTNTANSSSGQPVEMVAMLNNCSSKCTHDSHHVSTTFREKLHEIRGHPWWGHVIPPQTAFEMKLAAVKRR